MNVNLSGIIPVQFGQVPKNMAWVSTKNSLFINMLDSLMVENIPETFMAATPVKNDVSVKDINLLEIIGKEIDLSKSDPVTELYENLGLKEIESVEQDDAKETDDNLIASIGVISQYLAYIPKYEAESYEVLKADDSMKVLNDLINQSKPKSESIQSLKMQEQQNPVQDKISPEVPQTEIIKEVSTYAERLITLIENSRNKLKNEIDINANLAQKNKLMFSENKIIQVSDESSYIKSSAISQIKDKIELLVNERTNGTKEVTMELQPEKLGKVNIKMFYEGNKLTVEIKALNEETSKLLMSNSQELAKVLNKSLDFNVNVIVKHDETVYGQNPLDYNQDQNKNQQKNNYTYSGNNQDDNDDDMFSQIMNSTA